MFSFRHHYIILSLFFILAIVLPRIAMADVADVKAVQCKMSVVRILGNSPDGCKSGSGFIIGPDGLIITNYHVVKACTALNILVKEGNKSARVYHGQILALDSEHDLALIRIAASPLHPLPKPLKIKEAEPQVLNEVLAMGFPHVLDMPNLVQALQGAEETDGVIRNPIVLESLEPNITKGTITKITHMFITHDAKIDHGNSGGPLIDASTGEVVGINAAGAGKDVTFFLAIPPLQIKNFIDQNSSGKKQSFPLQPDNQGNDDSSSRISSLLEDGAKGNVDAQYFLGICYRDGLRGGAPSNQQAIYWLTQAAMQKYIPAMLDLAIIYQQDQDKQGSMDEAVRWLTQAAELNDVTAQEELARIYTYGIGVPPSHQKALPWLQRATDQESVFALSLLASYYANGWGVPRSDKTAIKLYERAVSSKDAQAQYSYGRYYFDRGTKENYVKAVSWFLKAAEQKNSSAQNMLGHCYETGKGVSQSSLQAFEWYTRAAQNGAPEGEINLAKCYLTGRGTAPDEELAIFWINKAIEQKLPHAFLMLAKCYEKGTGVIRSKKLSLKYCRKAAELNEPYAQLQMGIIYATGDGVLKSKQEAKYWFNQALCSDVPEVVKIARGCLKRLSRE